MATDVQAVGGRLEAVVPKRVTDSGDRLRLALLFAVALAIHTWAIATTKVTARDSIGFARTALQLEHPDYARSPLESGDKAPKLTAVDVIKRSQHPPGYPLAVLAVSHVLREVAPVDDHELPEQMLLATQIVSGVAGVLLVVPLYLLGRMLFGKTAGVVAALLFQVLPVPAHVTSDGLTEGLYLLGLGTALAFGVRAVRRPGIGAFLLCGLFTGATYWVRPEGALVAAAVGTVALALAAVGRWKRGETAGRLTALVVGVLLVAAPYMVLIEGLTNKPSANSVFERLPFRGVKELITTDAGAVPDNAVRRDASLFGIWYRGQDVDGPRWLWMPYAIGYETLKSFHYSVLGFALIGLVIAFGRLRPEPALAVPMVMGLFSLFALIALTGLKSYDPGDPGKQVYVSGRHTLPLVYVGCVFAAAGIEAIPRFLGRVFGSGAWVARPAFGWVLVALVVASALPAAIRPEHSSRVGHKEAGKYIREHADVEDALIDPFDYAAFYSGRTLRAISPDPPPKVGRFRWAVLEPSERHESALPRLAAAQAVASDTLNKAIVVKHWPEHEDRSKAKVVLYKQAFTSEEEAEWKARHEAALKQAAEEVARKAAEQQK